MAEAKKRRLQKKDWDNVESFVNDTYNARKDSQRRKEHEAKWKEVDRQIEMQPLKKVLVGGKQAPKEQQWESAIELGELSTASEIIADDVMRIVFQKDVWFDPHVELKWPIDPQKGRPVMDNDKQAIADGLLRSLMVQQHKDFGLKQRFRLSVKEALHHGGLSAEIRFEKQMMVKDGDMVKTVGAPVWIPYSMWNTYPDPSPSVIGTNMFYTGSMILVEYMPLYKLKELAAKTDGYIQERLKLVEKRSNKNMDEDTEDVEIIKFKGDVVIERGDGDIYLPNSEVRLANGKLIYWATGDLPYPNVIYSGYERQDVRDPYYTSPIIKMSPTHKMNTITANEFIDGTKLKLKPPIEYDSNDPDYAMNDGPVLAPGAKTGTRSMGQGMKALEIGDPRFALDAYSLLTQQMKEGLGVSANRSGVRDVDRETATAANLANQGAEVRTMGFIQQLEPQSLLPFLYMQHELNRRHLTEYTFYNDEMHTPDFVRASKKDIQANAHFEVVGSKGLLGEEQRSKKVMQTTAFFSGNPLFAPKLNVTEIMLEAYRDAGKKNPEEFVKADDKGPQIPPQVMEKMKEMQAIIQQVSEENKALKSKHDETMAKLSLDAKKHQDEMQQSRVEFSAQMEQNRKDFMLEVAKFKADIARDQATMQNERAQTVVSLNAGDEIGKVARNLEALAVSQGDALQKASEMIQDAASKMVVAEQEKQKNGRRKVKVKRTAEGFEVE